MKPQNFFIFFLLAVLFFVVWERFPRAGINPAPIGPRPDSVPYFVFPQNPVALPQAEISASMPAETSSSSHPLLQVETAYAGFLGGASVYVQNPDARWPLASLTKLMTAVVALRHFSLGDVVTIAPDAFQMSAREADEVPLEAGQSYRVKDLLMMMLLPSSNRAADALAASAGRAQFIAEMNSQAASWGMADTHYDEPTGLSVLNQSTAHDLALLASHMYTEDPQIFSFTRETAYTATELRSGKSLMVQSINAFAGQANFLGGKTGYTDEASGNLLSLFEERGQPLVVVVMGTSDRFGQTQRIMDWLAKTAEGG